MISIVSFVGHRNSGKTQLLAQLIPVLAERGHRIGVVKHAPDLEQTDAPGSDSAICLDAGADRVLLRGAARSAVHWAHTEELGAEEIERQFPKCDLVLVEGLKHGPFPKVEVFRQGAVTVRRPIAGDIDVVAVVSADPVGVPDDVVVLSPSRPDQIADFIEDVLLGIEP
jgi:molybdopterin-guanine dinucleotide biosynthesis protein B